MPSNPATDRAWKGVHVWNAHLHLANCDKALWRYGWGPARPLGLDTLRHRIRCAWRVLIGQYDVVSWELLASRASAHGGEE